MITRRAFAIAAVAAAGRPAVALAADDDRQTLQALAAYQQAVVERYDVTLRDAPLTGTDRATLRRFRADAAGAAVAGHNALEQAGGKPAAIPPASPPADTSRRGWLRELIALESAAVRAYYDSLQTLTGERHLKGSAALMAQAGRRLVALRSLSGDPLLPRKFETGTA
jgi:hypothetical protein